MAETDQTNNLNSLVDMISEKEQYLSKLEERGAVILVQLNTEREEFEKYKEEQLASIENNRYEEDKKLKSQLEKLKKKDEELIDRENHINMVAGQQNEREKIIAIKSKELEQIEIQYKDIEEKISKNEQLTNELQEEKKEISSMIKKNHEILDKISNEKKENEELLSRIKTNQLVIENRQDELEQSIELNIEILD